MCEYIKTKFPHTYLYTSTNGGALNDERSRRLVHSGIDEVTFSIDGASQAVYEKYRQRGKFDLANANMRAMAEEKARHGRDVPQINWRYILFNWNDHDEEMEKARAMAAEFGVDRLTWEITDHPEDSFSRRFAPGTPDFERIRHEVWDQSGLGNAISGATPRAEIAVRAAADVLSGRAGETLVIQTHVKNLSTRPFRKVASYGRRVVRLGAQLVGPDGTLLPDHACAWCHCPCGGAADVAIEVPPRDARPLRAARPRERGHRPVRAGCRRRHATSMQQRVVELPELWTPCPRLVRQRAQ
jgi:hypothetical protein